MGANLLGYTDFRAFLMDHLNHKRSQNPSWSYTIWAKQLRLKSSSTLIMILNGQRNPGRALIQDLCRYFQFTEEEERYFSDLVSLARARNDVKTGLKLLKQLEQRHPGKGFRLLDQDTFQAISGWHHYVIREMVQLPHFREDPDWISSQLRFPVSPERVREAIRTLLRLGLLARDPKGRLISTSTHLDTRTDLADEGLRRHHEQQLENARNALRQQAPEEREISGGCFAIRSSDLERAKQMIRSFQIELCNEVECLEGDQVFQIEMAFFPLTKRPEDSLQ